MGIGAMRDDHLSYRQYQEIDRLVTGPLDRANSWTRYLLNGYWYLRSRLNAPGRAYDTDDAGMLAIGGAAHCDVMDLDVRMRREYAPPQRTTAYEWSIDATPESVAYWRGRARDERSAGRAAQAIRRERDALAAKDET